MRSFAFALLVLAQLTVVATESEYDPTNGGAEADDAAALLEAAVATESGEKDHKTDTQALSQAGATGNEHVDNEGYALFETAITAKSGDEEKKTDTLTLSSPGDRWESDATGSWDVDDEAALLDTAASGDNEKKTDTASGWSLRSFSNTPSTDKFFEQDMAAAQDQDGLTDDRWRTDAAGSANVDDESALLETDADESLPASGWSLRGSSSAPSSDKSLEQELAAAQEDYALIDNMWDPTMGENVDDDVALSGTSTV